MIVAIGDTPQTNHVVTLECGHHPDLVPHFHYKAGTRIHCFKCGPKGSVEGSPIGVYPDWRIEELAHKYAPADAYDPPDHEPYYTESNLEDIYE